MRSRYGALVESAHAGTRGPRMSDCDCAVSDEFTRSNAAHMNVLAVTESSLPVSEDCSPQLAFASIALTHASRPNSQVGWGKRTTQKLELRLAHQARRCRIVRRPMPT